MPPKKASSGKKKKKKGLVDVPPVPRSLYGVGSGNENVEKVLLEKLVTRADLVFIRLKQIDWAYSDFTVMVHSNAPLYTLCRKIEEKHGRVATNMHTGLSSLQLYRHPPNEKNLIAQADWYLRLDQLGIQGGTVEEQHQAIIYYNYIPSASTPILQREPALMLQQLTQEESELEQEKLAANRESNLEMEFMSNMEMNSGSNSTAMDGGGAAKSARMQQTTAIPSATRATSAAAAAPSSSSSAGLPHMTPRSAIGMSSGKV